MSQKVGFFFEPILRAGFLDKMLVLSSDFWLFWLLYFIVFLQILLDRSLFSQTAPLTTIVVIFNAELR